MEITFNQFIYKRFVKSSYGNGLENPFGNVLF